MALPPLQHPALMVVTPWRLLSRLSSDPILARDMASAGIDILQIRCRHRVDRQLYEAVERLAEALSHHPCLLIMNDRLDMALALGLDGVHLGFASLSPEQARQVVRRSPAGGNLLIGRSLHAVEEVERARFIDYAVYGPVYDTPSKRGWVEPRGLDDLRAACATARRRGLLLLAIGGIDVERVEPVLACGADGVALLSGIADAADPAAAVRAYREGLDRTR